MKTNVTFNQIVENLTKVYNSTEETAVYNSNSEQYMGICGWCGVMSPLTRPAYLKHFGPATVEKAEQEARARLAANETQYNESAHAAHVIEAAKHQAQGNPAPVMAGAFVWGIHSGLKCDGGDGLHEEIHNMTAYADMENRRPDLCKVCKVYEVSAADFARPELADELVQQQGEDFPGGAGIDEEDENRRDIFDEYRYYFTECAAVVCRESGRWYLINSEGYTYARYILLPTSWREMYGAEVSEEERKEQERKEAEQRKEAEEKAARLADYETRCNKWAKLLQDVLPLEEAAEQAKKLHGWGSKEYKQADRALSAARRKNIQTMAAHHFPGVKFSVKKSDHWNAAYDVTYTDGPTLETFGKFTDFALFVQCVETFNGWDDSTDYHHKEFTAFAEKYAGFAYGQVRTEREQSDESRAELLALVQEVAGISDDDRHDWSRATLEAIANRAGVDGDKLEHTIMYEGRVTAAFVARCVFNLKDYTEPTTEPTKPNGRKQATASATLQESGKSAESTAQSDEAPAEGLRLIETAEGVAVIGNDWRDTYYNKKQIKAHGATWNKDRKQWEATAAEDVASLRAWFALREEEQTAAPEQTSETVAPVIESGEIEESREVTNPIKAEDLHTPRVLQYSERRYIVEGCTTEQAEELEQKGGKRTADGVIFAASKATRGMLHVWQNEQSRKERAAILGNGWQYVEGLNHGTQPGDLITCIDGTHGRVTKSDPELCCIEFETADGQRLSVAGYFRKERNYSTSEKSEPTDADKSTSWKTSYTAEDFQKLTTTGEINEEDRDIIGKRFRYAGKNGEPFAELQIFVQDYAGNEAHALLYAWDEFMQEVRANVRPLSWLREHLTEANGWQAA